MSENEYSEVFEEYFQSYRKEEHAACDFGFAAEFFACFCAHQHSEQRNDEGCASDECDGSPYVDGKECERYADGERVNAGRNGHHEESFHTEA